MTVTARNRKPRPLPPETPASELPSKLTSGQAAQWLDISRKNLARLFAQGKLSREPGLDSRYVLVPRDQVVALRATDYRFMDKAS